MLCRVGRRGVIFLKFWAGSGPGVREGSVMVRVDRRGVIFLENWAGFGPGVRGVRAG